MENYARYDSQPMSEEVLENQTYTRAGRFRLKYFRDSQMLHVYETYRTKNAEGEEIMRDAKVKISKDDLARYPELKILLRQFLLE